MRSFAKLLILHTLFCAPAAAATLQTDTFDSEILGWSWGFGVGPSHVATGGPAGAGDGYLSNPSHPDNSHLATINVEGRWVGNYSAVGATRVTADLMSPVGSAALQIRLVLFPESGGRWTSTVAHSIPTDGIWRPYIFSISEVDLTQVAGIETYAEMMTTVQRVMLRHQSGEPASSGNFVNPSTLNIDNIELAANPTPIAGDFDGSGEVDNVDLTHPSLGFNVRLGVDFEGADFLDWQRNYGLPQGAAVAATVPEPSATALAAATMALMSRRLRRTMAVGF